MAKATNIYFSWFWSLRSPRLKGSQILCLVRACFLVHSHLLTTSSLGGRDKAALWGYFSVDMHPVHEGSTLMT